MAKRKNFPKPLYLTPKVLEYYHNKFISNLRVDLFSDNNIYYSKNCINKHLAYDIGKLNGTYAHESWVEEKKNFSIFIISDEDYQNALKGIFSEDVRFFIDSINKRQTIKDEERQKITADVYIVKESDFYEFYKDRTAYVKQYLDKSCFSENHLYLLATMSNTNLF